MTTLNHSTKFCALCNHLVEHTLVASYSNYGHCDLDLRPPRMERDNIHYMVHRCQKCGFCAEDLSRIIKEVIVENGSIEEVLLADDEIIHDDLYWKACDSFDIIKSEAYRTQLEDPHYPELANSFLCKSIFEIKLENLSSAVWSTINAAWVCDDHEKNNSAKSCRNKALEIINEIHKQNRSLIPEDESDTLLQVDLLRRAGWFDEALNIIRNKRPGIEADQLKNILNFQETLIENRDDNCHRIPSEDE